MSNVENRIKRIEEQLQASTCDCVKDASDAVAILLVEKDWSADRIRAEEESQFVLCPVHGRQVRPVVRFSGSDIYG